MTLNTNVNTDLLSKLLFAFTMIDQGSLENNPKARPLGNMNLAKPSLLERLDVSNVPVVDPAIARDGRSGEDPSSFPFECLLSLHLRDILSIGVLTVHHWVGGVSNIGCGRSG